MDGWFSPATTAPISPGVRTPRGQRGDAWSWARPCHRPSARCRREPVGQSLTSVPGTQRPSPSSSSRFQIGAWTLIRSIALQGIYTHELVDPRQLGTLLGTQQAVFGVGGAIGPAVAGALLGATGSYSPTILIATAGFTTAACLLLVSTTRTTRHATRATKCNTP